MSGKAEWCWIQSDWVGSNRIESDRVGSDRFGSDRVRSGRIGSDRIRSDLVENCKFTTFDVAQLNYKIR